MRNSYHMPQGGFRRGDFVEINASRHEYKTGLTPPEEPFVTLGVDTSSASGDESIVLQALAASVTWEKMVETEGGTHVLGSLRNSQVSYSGSPASPQAHTVKYTLLSSAVCWEHLIDIDGVTYASGKFIK